MTLRRVYASIIHQYGLNYFIVRSYHKLVVRYPIFKPDKISFEFFYPLDDPSKKKKRFSLLRPKNEDISIFLSRIKVKVNIEFQKMLTKKCKSKLASIDLTGYTLDNVSVRLNGSNSEISSGNSLDNVFVNNSILKLNGTEYITVINTPLLVSIKLPKMIICNCPLIALVKLEHGKLTDLEFEWLISIDGIKWKSVCRGPVFTPSIDYISNYLKVVATCNETEQTMTVQSKSTIVECPIQRAINHRLNLTQTFVEDVHTFRVLSYNLLAPAYSDSTLARNVLFRYCPEDCLIMDYRQHLLMREIRGYHSDIICLQEVDSSMFENWIEPILNDVGYNGIMMSKNGTIPEGQAIFWRRSKLSLVYDLSTPSLSDLILKNTMFSLTQIKDWIRSSGDELQKWMEMRQCMAGCVLETSDGHQLMVANTHLYFKPESRNVRLFQMAAIISYLEETKVRYPQASLILCGDFNDFRGAPVIDFIEKAKANIKINSRNMDICHSQTLTSAYNVPFTNYVADFVGEIDFIFHDNKLLSCERTIPLPSSKDITENVALPNKEFPSDHLALVAELKFIEDSVK